MTCPKCSAENPDGQDRCSACQSWLPNNSMVIRGSAPLHGATTVALDVRADAISAELDDVLAGQPGSEPRFARARWLASRSLARFELIEDYLNRTGFYDSKGRPRQALRQLNEAHAGAMAALSALGMTPAAASRLGLNLQKTQLTMAERIAAERKSVR